MTKDNYTKQEWAARFPLLPQDASLQNTVYLFNNFNNLAPREQYSQQNGTTAPEGQPFVDNWDVVGYGTSQVYNTQEQLAPNQLGAKQPNGEGIEYLNLESQIGQNLTTDQYPNAEDQIENNPEYFNSQASLHL